ncbi:MAG TPA: HD domain-containing protein [Candidatus Hydrogenedentes bacterium]|nr:HD domain-containing protein [Candidatus Hydrogenedentota bacterium]HPG66833.1 HD domain-containing protein [Candidatus Hydrogenedentota bacterium]
MSKKNKAARSVHVARDPGLQAAVVLMEEYDPEPEHARQVCAVSVALFSAFEATHGLGARERRLLVAAALLHDIGYSVAMRAHHKHAQDIIARSELDGFSARERSMIACIARYHRKAHPSTSHAMFAALGGDDRRVVSRLAALLRLADGLDRSHMASVLTVRAAKQGDGVRLEVEQRQPNATDLGGGERKKGLFEAVYGTRLEIVSVRR